MVRQNNHFAEPVASADSQGHGIFRQYEVA